MCGIIGYIGRRPALNILLEGLGRLEYRGYDSAGVAITVNGEINCVKELRIDKKKGVVENLKSKIEVNFEKLVGNIGIGHNRWATHGVPSVANAHPHTDCTGKIFVVHNGVIENYQRLRRILQRLGHVFTSETDTEVITHLIEAYNEGDIEVAFKKAIRRLHGAYGIVMIYAGEPDKIFVAKFCSPMVLGIGDGENFVASCPTAIVTHTRRVIYLEDGEMAVIKANSYKIYNAKNERIKKDTEHIDWDLKTIEKGGYPNFLLKEINQQTETIGDVLRGKLDYENGLVVAGGLNDIADELKEVNRISIVACGTSYYAGLIGGRLMKELVGLPVEVTVASEFLYDTMIIDNRTLIVVISQSGETSDTLNVAKVVKSKGSVVAGIINVLGSSIPRALGYGMYTHAGPEISVASTKAFTSQIVTLVLMAVYLGRQRCMTAAEAVVIFRELEMLPGKVKDILSKESEIQALAEKYHKKKHFAVLGRGYSLAVALEGALKIKELSYIHAEGYPAGEFKHGPIALIDKGFPTIGVMPSDNLREKVFSNLKEVVARDGELVVIATEGDKGVLELTKDVFFIPSTLDFLNPILLVVPFQLLAHDLAVLNGCDVDQPRNLAKSVTVE